MVFGLFLPESKRSWQESTGKNLDNFTMEYCFHVPARSGGRNIRPGYEDLIFLYSDLALQKTFFLFID
jgi:hypothetical protein